jgi:integrase
MMHLEVRHRTFYAVQDVPRPLQQVMGMKRLKVSLKTDDPALARARRHAALAEFQRRFEAARNGLGTVAASVVEQAMEWRTLPHDDGLPDGVDYLMDKAEQIEVQQGEDAARTFHAIASGKETPLLQFVEHWLAEGGRKGPLNPRTAGQYRADLRELEAWMKEARLPPTIEALTRKIAGRYCTEALASKSIGTRNRKISTASSYWSWLEKRGHFEGLNPWHKQSFAKAPAHRGGDKEKSRPFTTDEVRTLLAGRPDDELADALRLALLTGARINELYKLTVRQCADGWFQIEEGKTANAIRRVPIHSALAEIVARRVKDKAPDDYLMHEPEEVPPGRERAANASKRFTTYRRGLGVDDLRPGKRRSLVTFHSTRNWFITEARRAKVDLYVIQAVVGHEHENITDKVYTGAPPDADLIACVASVQLPPHEKTGSPAQNPEGN